MSEVKRPSVNCAVVCATRYAVKPVLMCSLQVGWRSKLQSLSKATQKKFIVSQAVEMRKVSIFILFASPAHQLSNTLKTTKMSEKLNYSLVFPFKRGKCPFAVLLLSLLPQGLQLFANPSPPTSSNTVPQPW